jgi:ketosteroid isomerase-like protein
MSNLSTIQSVYAAFGRGDVPAILELVAEDVAWDRFRHGNSAQDAGLPYLAERSGREGVAGFFTALAENLEFDAFEPVALLEGDGHVVALIDESVTNRRTGKSFKDRAAHVWSFDEAGRITALSHLVDTAKHIAAATG